MSEERQKVRIKEIFKKIKVLKTKEGIKYIKMLKIKG